MTYQEIFTNLEKSGLPVAFNFFKVGEVPDLPYIVFTYPDNNDFIADNRNYSTIVSLDVELYTENKSIPDETALEAVLAEYFPPYTKTSSWITSENMQMTTYSMEVLVNG